MHLHVMHRVSGPRDVHCQQSSACKDCVMPLVVRSRHSLHLFMRLAGYLGHMTFIANKVVEATEDCILPLDLEGFSICVCACPAQAIWAM